MIAALLSQLDRISRVIAPLMLSIALLIVAMLPFRLPGLARVTPDVALVAVFYWSVYRPDLFPPSSAFLLGLFQDVLTGGPLGASALVLLLVCGLVRSQRRFFLGKSFGVVWWAFGLVAAAASLIGWVAAMVLAFAPIGPAPAMFQWVLTFSMYPFLTWLFARTQASMIEDG
jgi:rod shape-determining protein MreD